MNAGTSPAALGLAELIWAGLVYYPFPAVGHRRGWAGFFPKIVEALAERFHGEVVLDGELVAQVAQWLANEVQSRGGAGTFCPATATSGALGGDPSTQAGTGARSADQAGTAT